MLPFRHRARRFLFESERVGLIQLRNTERTLDDLDEIDTGIIRLLQADGRIPTAQMARRLGTSEPTIRKRVDRLVADEIIRITAVLNPHRTGFASNVLIMFKIRSDRLLEVGERLAEHERVVYLGYTTGNFDVLAEMLFHNDQEVFDFLKNEVTQIDGIVETSTSHVVRSRRVDYRWTVDTGSPRTPGLGGADLRIVACPDSSAATQAADELE